MIRTYEDLASVISRLLSKLDSMPPSTMITVTTAAGRTASLSVQEILHGVDGLASVGADLVEKVRRGELRGPLPTDQDTREYAEMIGLIAKAVGVEKSGATWLLIGAGVLVGGFVLLKVLR